MFVKQKPSSVSEQEVRVQDKDGDIGEWEQIHEEKSMDTVGSQIIIYEIKQKKP